MTVSTHSLIHSLIQKAVPDGPTSHPPPSHPPPTAHSSEGHMRGVDSKLAQNLLDELLEKDTNITWNDIGMTGAPQCYVTVT